LRCLLTNVRSGLQGYLLEKFLVYSVHFFFLLRFPGICSKICGMRAPALLPETRTADSSRSPDVAAVDAQLAKLVANGAHREVGGASGQVSL
jgi:hypothetical protein